MNNIKNECSFDNFLALDIRTGTIMLFRSNHKTIQKRKFDWKKNSRNRKLSQKTNSKFFLRMFSIGSGKRKRRSRFIKCQ